MAQHRHSDKNGPLSVEESHEYQNPTNRLARWQLALADFDFEIQHLSGKANVIADALNIEFLRKNTGLVATKEADGALTIIDLPKDGVTQTVQSMIQAQGRDEFCSSCVDYLQTGALPDDAKQANYVVAHARNMGLTGQPGLLVYHWDTSGSFRQRVRRVQVVVPADQAIRKQLIAWAHSLGVGGQTGTTKTMATLRAHWWKNQYQDVLTYVRSCERCQRQKNPAAHLRARPGPCRQPGSDAPGQEWHIGSTKVCKVDVMVYADVFSRWPEVKIFEEPPTGRSMMEALVEKVVSRWGVPSRTHLDNISYNKERGFRAACERMGITCSYSTEYRSEANGLVEAKLGTLKKLIRSVACKNPANWKALMPLALLVYRYAVNRTTGLNPFYINTGRQCVLP
ncbi:unnamed protein product, partial [Heterosigma akashiwo]